MGLIFNSLEAYKVALDLAIDDALGSELAEMAKEQIQSTVGEIVYAYPPEYVNRRRTMGGLIDTANMEDEVFGQELTIKMVATWQQRGFRYKGGRELGDFTETIQTSSLYHAPARPYTDQAENKVGEMIEQQIAGALRRRGF